MINMGDYANVLKRLALYRKLLIVKSVRENFSPEKRHIMLDRKQIRLEFEQEREKVCKYSASVSPE